MSEKRNEVVWLIEQIDTKRKRSSGLVKNWMFLDKAEAIEHARMWCNASYLFKYRARKYVSEESTKPRKSSPRRLKNDSGKRSTT